jgi:hypothetical protein
VSTFTDPIAALEEAEFLAERYGEPIYLVLVDGSIEVRRHLTPDSVMLEIVKPVWWSS